MNLKELRAKLRGFVAQMRQALEAGNDALYKELKDKADETRAKIERLEEIEGLEENAGEPEQPSNRGPPSQERTPNQPRQESEPSNEVRDRLMNAANNPPAPSMANTGEGVNNGFSEQERRTLDGFRLTNYLHECVRMMRSGGGGLSGLNREVYDMAATEAGECGIEIQGAGIPHNVLSYTQRIDQPVNWNRVRNLNRQFAPRADMIAETDTQGGHLIDTELRSPIDILRSRLQVLNMGATVMTGLRSNIDFPVWEAGSDPSEKSENAAADEYSPTLDKFTMSPERLPVFTEVSNQLLVQQSIDVEAWLRMELGYRLAKRLDQRAINGSGSNDQPTGVLSKSNVNVVAIATDGGALTRDHLVDLETAIAEDDADESVMGFLTTPGVRGHLKKTKVDAGSGQFVWPRGTGPAELEGYRAAVSTNVPKDLTKGAGTDLHAMIFGVWRHMMIGQWGGIDIIVNPFSRDTEGLIRITYTLFYDVNFRYPEAFAVIKDIDIS